MKRPIKIYQNYRLRTIDMLVFSNDTCNFDCYYCYNNKPRTQQYIKLSFVYEFIQYVIMRTGLNVFVELIGGEPTLHTDIMSFCKQISMNKNITCGIYTNFSYDFEKYIQLLNMGINLTITYHNQYNKDLFIKKINQIPFYFFEKNMIDIRIMLEHLYFDDCLSILKKLKPTHGKYIESCLLDHDNNNHIYHISDNILNKCYTSQQMLQYYDTLIGTCQDRKLYTVEYDDKSIQNISINEAADTKIFNSFKYWQCNASKEFFYVNYNGNIYPCQAFINRHPIANIYDKQSINDLKFKSVICPTDECHCLWEVYKQRIF